jgi:hypothetical protein
MKRRIVKMTLNYGAIKMSEVSITIRLPFQQLLKAIEGLTEQERLVLRKKLEQQTPTSWQARFERALNLLGEKNKDVPSEQVQSDVERAIQEVRAIRDRQN